MRRMWGRGVEQHGYSTWQLSTCRKSPHSVSVSRQQRRGLKRESQQARRTAADLELSGDGREQVVLVVLDGRWWRRWRRGEERAGARARGVRRLDRAAGRGAEHRPARAGGVPLRRVDLGAEVRGGEERAGAVPGDRAVGDLLPNESDRAGHGRRRVSLRRRVLAGGTDDRCVTSLAVLCSYSCCSCCC